MRLTTAHDIYFVKGAYLIECNFAFLWSLLFITYIPQRKLSVLTQVTCLALDKQNAKSKITRETGIHYSFQNHEKHTFTHQDNQLNTHKVQKHEQTNDVRWFFNVSKNSL